MRRFIFTAAIPAGTDSLGFVSRSSQYASFGTFFGAWSPASFGSRRVFDFDNFIGVATIITRSPLITIKALDVITLLGAGLATYFLAWRWYANRRAAAIAGILFMTSQTVLARWGTGMLNVEIIIALAPAILLAWSVCIEEFTLVSAIGLSFVLGIAFLIRADLVLYFVPFLTIYPLVVLMRRGTIKRGVANLARTLAIAVPGILFINAAWLLPTMRGYRPQYETLSQMFNIGSLSIRTIDLYPSLLGFAREIGYFDFTGMQTWYSYPGLPLWAYYAVASIIPLLALSALRWYRGRSTVFLVLAVVLATFAAPGTRAPLGPLYYWAALHVPIFGNLRDPNRWLIIQAISYSLLASLTIERTADKVSQIITGRAWPKLRRWRPTAVANVVALTLVVVGTVAVMPAFISGLRTWQLTSGQRALLGDIRTAPPLSLTASIPFDQDYRFLVQGSYRGYEHDLGQESVLFTGRQSIGTGSWDQRSANFVAYATTLLLTHNPAFVPMLGAAGVSRITSFHYPLVAPQLTGAGATAFSQQNEVSAFPGLAATLTNRAGTDYAVQGAASPLSFRRNLAVVLGGSEGIAALADRPNFRLSDWAVFTAGDVIAASGYSRLLSLIRSAKIVLLADERPADIAVEGTQPLAKLAGITSDPQIARLETDFPTDRSAQQGSLADPTIAIPQPLSTSSSSRFTVNSARSVEIWARVLSTPSVATIQAHVDDKMVSSITPVTVGSGGFEWVRLATVHASAGTHTVTISARPSLYGDNYEMQEARIINPKALGVAQARLKSALKASSSHIAYALNLDEITKWSWKSIAETLAKDRNSRPFSLHRWFAPAGSDTSVKGVAAPGNASAPQFTAQTGRSVYTVAKILYKKPRDWKASPYIYLDFRGGDSGKVYTLAFEFNNSTENSANYLITDNFRGWKTLAFPTSGPGPGSGMANWSNVTSVLLALPSKSESGTFAVGLPHVSKKVAFIRVAVPLVPGAKAPASSAVQPHCFARVSTHSVTWFPSKHDFRIPVGNLKPSCSVYIPPRSGYRQYAEEAIPVHQVEDDRWSYSMRTNHSGVLVWNQAYDPFWMLSSGGPTPASVPVMSALNGYIIGPGAHVGIIGFTQLPVTRIGILITLAAISMSLLIAAISARCRRFKGGGRHIAYTAADAFAGEAKASSGLTRELKLGIFIGSALIVSCPIAAWSGFTSVIPPVSCTILLTFALCAIQVARLRVCSPSAEDTHTIPSREPALDASVRS